MCEPWMNSIGSPDPTTSYPSSIPSTLAWSMTAPSWCAGRSAQRRHMCRRDATRRVAHVEWDGHWPEHRSRMAEQPGVGGSNGPAGDAVRPSRRGEHRLPGRGRRTGRPGVGLRAGFQHRGVLGGTVARGVPPEALGVHPPDPLRPPWLRAFGPPRHDGHADARGADGRRPCRPGRRRFPAGLDPWDLRGRLAGGTVRGDPSGADGTHHSLWNPHPLRGACPVSGGCGRRYDRWFRRP
jgi:hypothetical protein